MRRVLLLIGGAICFIAVAAHCNSSHAQTPPVHTLQTNDAEIDYQMKLNSLACKSVGLDDGGQVCEAGKFLNAKLLEAKKPKLSPEPKKDP